MIYIVTEPGTENIHIVTNEMALAQKVRDQESSRRVIVYRAPFNYNDLCSYCRKKGTFCKACSRRMAGK